MLLYLLKETIIVGSDIFAYLSILIAIVLTQNAVIACYVRRGSVTFRPSAIRQRKSLTRGNDSCI